MSPVLVVACNVTVIVRETVGGSGAVRKRKGQRWCNDAQCVKCGDKECRLEAQSFWQSCKHLRLLSSFRCSSINSRFGVARRPSEFVGSTWPRKVMCHKQHIPTPSIVRCKMRWSGRFKSFWKPTISSARSLLNVSGATSSLEMPSFRFARRGMASCTGNTTSPWASWQWCPSFRCTY
jgi:hypothetical protein